MMERANYHNNHRSSDDCCIACLRRRAEKAEAQLQEVRETCDEALTETPMPPGEYRRGYNAKAKVILALLDGGDTEPELDIPISSYAKEAGDGEVPCNNHSEDIGHIAGAGA